MDINVISTLDCLDDFECRVSLQQEFILAAIMGNRCNICPSTGTGRDCDDESVIATKLRTL